MPDLARAARFRRSGEGLPLILGHRGARHAAPENTMAAFELARQEGADGIEFDVRLDGDGAVIVLHDPRLTRVSDGRSLAVAEELSTDALRAIDVGRGERVPLLREVLAWSREHDLCLNIEVKADVRSRRRLVERVIAELTPERDATERLLLSSFHPAVVRALARSLPEFAVAWLVHRKQPLLRFAPGWRLLQAAGVNPEHALLSAANVQRWKARGAIIATWTVNEPRLATAYALFGVDAIISDQPGALREGMTSAPRF